MPGESNQRWPIDLRIFGAAALLWAVMVVLRVFFQEDVLPADPLEAVIAGLKFHGENARIVLLLEAAVFWSFGIGIIAERKWGLLLALGYMSEVVVSHLVFVIAHLDDSPELIHVRRAAIEGPPMVLIALYLWIRSNELIFRG
jgi:hypothetical protein